MSTKWTPGPWHAEFYEYGGYDGMTSSIEITANDGGTHVCELDFTHYGQRWDQQPRTADACLLAVANARLISAAPELYEACDAVDRCGRNANADGDVTIPSEVWDLLAQALSRARGES